MLYTMLVTVFYSRLFTSFFGGYSTSSPFLPVTPSLAAGCSRSVVCLAFSLIHTHVLLGFLRFFYGGYLLSCTLRDYKLCYRPQLVRTHVHIYQVITTDSFRQPYNRSVISLSLSTLWGPLDIPSHHDALESG